MSDGPVRPILCGGCHVEVEGRIDADGNRTVTCPVCRRTDSFDNALREASEHLVDKSVRDTFSGIGGGSMTVNSPPKRDYRFIMG